MILFYFELYKFTKDESYLDTCTFLIEKCLHVINSTYNWSYTICNGLSGLGYVLEYIKKSEMIDDSEFNFFENIDNALHLKFINFTKINNFDFVHGATGIIWY